MYLESDDDRAFEQFMNWKDTGLTSQQEVRKWRRRAIAGWSLVAVLCAALLLR